MIPNLIRFSRPILITKIMKRVLTFLLILVVTGLSGAYAQTENTNLPGGIKVPGGKGWLPQFTYTNIPKSGSYGAESDGTYIYITKWSGDTIWRYTPAGVLDTAFKIPGVTGLRDLAYDGTHFYGGSNTTSIYKMDFTNFTLVSTINASAAGTGVTVRHICYDPVTDAFWVGAWGSNIALISKTGALLSTIASATHGQASMAGSAYDTVTPGGPYIWVISAGSAPATISQISVATGLTVGTHQTTDDINATLQATSGGGLFITPNLISGTVTMGGIIQNEMLFGYDLASVIPDSFDIALQNLDINSTLITNQPVQIKGTIKNNGLVTLNSFDLAYTIDGGAAMSQSITGLNLTTGQTYNFTHGTNWTPTAGGTYALKVWTANPNGQADMKPANDTLTKVLNVIDTFVTKKVLIEQATGAWCGYCPDGALVLQQILAANPGKVFTAAIHNGDGMAFTDGNTVNSAYGPAYPNAYIDRVLFPGESKVGVSRGVWAAKTNERLQAKVTVAVDGMTTYDPSNKRLTIELSATFFAAASGDYRVNAYIVEDSVTGTGSGYNQANYYNTTAGHPLQGLGNPIIGYNHRNVLRAMLGGPWGSTGVIPNSINKYDVFNKQYTYNIPASVNPNRLKVIVLVQKYSSVVTEREIINSNQQVIGFIDAINELNLNGDILAIYPNPVDQVAGMEFMLTKATDVTIDIFNLMGEKVQTSALGTLPMGEHYTQLDVTGMASGVYILKANFGGTVRTHKLVVR